MKQFIFVCLVLGVLAACQNSNPPVSGTAVPTELAYPTVLALPTLTPQPLTDPALTVFKKQLQEAFDAADGDKMRDTVSFSKWVASIYRQGGTMPIDPERGLTLSLQFIKENGLEIDPVRATYEPNWSVNDADTAEFVRVTPKNGADPYYAHLIITHEPGGWRYTGIMTRIPYYDAPSIAEVRANPTKYAGKEFMYVGTYEGRANPPTDAGAMPDEKAFIVNTFAGPIWVTMSDASYVHALDPNIDARKGQLVRMFGTIQLQDGAPYIVSDSVQFIADSNYAHTRGTIDAVDTAARRVTIGPTGNGAAALQLSTSTFISLPEAARGKLSDLKAGQTIDAIGVPQPDGSLLVEQLYIAR